VADIINSMGPTCCTFFPGSTTSRVAGRGLPADPDEEDAEAISKEILEVQVVAPYLRGRGQIVSGNQNWSTSIIGVTPDYFEAVNGASTTEDLRRGGVSRQLQAGASSATPWPRISFPARPFGFDHAASIESLSRLPACCRPRGTPWGDGTRTTWSSSDGPRRKKVFWVNGR